MLGGFGGREEGGGREYRCWVYFAVFVGWKRERDEEREKQKHGMKSWQVTERNASLIPFSLSFSVVLRSSNPQPFGWEASIESLLGLYLC